MSPKTVLAALAAALALAGCDSGAKNTYVPPPPAEVTVAAPVVEVVPETVESTGTLRGIETVPVRARVRGLIASRTFRGGERVEKGAVLFTIDPRPFEAAAAHARAQLQSKQVDLRLAELEVARYQELVRQGSSTQSELDQRLATRDAAKAAIELAQADLRIAELDLEWTVVRAPISGRTDLGPPPDVGALVGQSEPTLLCTITDDRKVYATYPLDEATVQRLRRAHDGKRPGEDGRPAYPVRIGLIDDVGYPYAGVFSRGDSALNPSTGTIQVEAELDNPTGMLMPGMFVRVQALVGQREALLVPEAAVLQDQRGRFVWIVGPDDTVARADVKIGPVVEGRRIIESGLTRDARVVVNGVQRARPGTKVVPTVAPATPAPVASR
jgi:RND family efflux transporter MFP subunit